MHKKWSVAVRGIKKCYIGLFDDELDAAHAYDDYIIKNNLNRRLNFPPPEPPTVIPNTRWICLTRGKWALIDARNYDRVSKYKWQAFKTKNGVYYAVANTNNGNEKIYLHRFILGITDSKIQVDHKDHDGLNNTEENIRACTSRQNLTNKRKNKANLNKYKNVYLDKKSNKWLSRIYIDGTVIYIGSSKSENTMAERYNMAAKWFHEEWACLSEIV